MSENMHRPVTTAELVAALRTVKCCASDAGLSECKMLSAIQRLLRRVDGDAPVQVGDARIAAAEERGRVEVEQRMDGYWSDERVQVEIREAEERGRRRGVEERDELRALLKEWLPRQCALKPWPPIGSMLACGKCLGCRTLIALAPRDSAPAHEDWCALFGNPEAGKSCDCKPRDSGKEGP